MLTWSHRHWTIAPPGKLVSIVSAIFGERIFTPRTGPQSFIDICGFFWEGKRKVCFGLYGPLMSRLRPFESIP